MKRKASRWLCLSACSANLGSVAGADCPLLPPPLSLFLSHSVKPVSRPSRAAHICPLCNKQFKNSYNLRRHQSVHTGIRMKDRVMRDDSVKGVQAGAGRTTVPLSLLHLSVPHPTPESVPHQPILGTQDIQPISVSITTAAVTMAASVPPPSAVVVAGAMVQVGL